jgi:hypothetical protein
MAVGNLSSDFLTPALNVFDQVAKHPHSASLLEW